MDVGERTGSTESLHEVKKRHIPEAGSGRVGAERALGSETAAALAGRWRRWAAAWLAWPACVPGMEQQFRVGLSQVADWALAFSGLSTSGCPSHRRNRMVSMPLSAVKRIPGPSIGIA